MAKGKVFWRNNELFIQWEKVKAGRTTYTQPVPVRDASVIKAMKQMNGLEEAEVDIELTSGNPNRITFISEELSVKAQQEVQERALIREEQRRKAQELEDENDDTKKAFYNPYNFVPAPNRKGIKNELGDGVPRGHDRYHENLLSGKLCVKMRVITPLLLPDTAKAIIKKYGEKATEIHKSFYVRVGANEKPYINPTAIKGMVRSAYEAITNSRLSVFSSKHVEKLAYREGIKKKDYRHSPAALLPDTLKPAIDRNNLSPADRVFGWIGQSLKKHNTYRGHLRIGTVTCNTDDAIEYFNKDRYEEWFPLQILGEPKTQQGRFYVAKDKEGNAQQKGLTTEQAGYNDSSKGLRGRKVYPHHKNLPADYWIDPTNSNLETSKKDLGFYKEYRRPDSNKQRDNQNRSIQGWVKQNVEFKFDMHFINLSAVEVGALIWLLSLEANQFHRFGGGKPLGFGSVHLSLEDGDIRKGEHWKEFYKSLEDNEIGKLDKAAVETLATDFKTLSDSIYPTILKSFIRASEGFDTNLPTHYPRARHEQNSSPLPPHIDGVAYEWFVENAKKSNNDNPETQFVLLDLVNEKGESDKGLPILYHKPRGNR